MAASRSGPRDGEAGREPRNEGRIVELVNLPSRFEADLLMARLDAAGIRAMAKYGDADGMAPSIGLLDGYRVCVFDDELDRATVVRDTLAD